jgi:hypothetical protein
MKSFLGIRRNAKRSRVRSADIANRNFILIQASDDLFFHEKIQAERTGLDRSGKNRPWIKLQKFDENLVIKI